MVDAGMSLPFLDHQKEVLRMILMNYHQQILYYAQHGFVRQSNYYHYPQHFQQSENHQMNTLHDHVHYGSNYQYQPISSGVHNNCNTCIHPQKFMNEKLIQNSSYCENDIQLPNVLCNQVKSLSITSQNPQPSNLSHQLNPPHPYAKQQRQQDQQKILIPTPLPSFPPSSAASTRTPSPSSHIISTAIEATSPVPPSVSTQTIVHSNDDDFIVSSNENNTKEGPSLMKSYETMLGRQLCDLL
ncbi:hypothetical protein BKA69DRAFT_408832 [Paraphysoderma sedebokerense]|nr:hypothetical protein BKA69DRAFT_408832 [Paraphysoderma sedebokerense]